MDKNHLLEYFIRHTDKRLDQIEKKIDQLMNDKAFILGNAKMISFTVSLAVSALMLFLKYI